MMQSPFFLYQVEQGEMTSEHPEYLRYSSVEMASRLAFFWNEGPDDELLKAGENGDLLTDDGIRKQATRLLENEKARRTVIGFGQYLDLSRLKGSGTRPRCLRRLYVNHATHAKRARTCLRRYYLS